MVWAQVKNNMRTKKRSYFCVLNTDFKKINSKNNPAHKINDHYKKLQSTQIMKKI